MHKVTERIDFTPIHRSCHIGMVRVSFPFSAFTQPRLPICIPLKFLIYNVSNDKLLGTKNLKPVTRLDTQYYGASQMHNYKATGRRFQTLQHESQVDCWDQFRSPGFMCSFPEIYNVLDFFVFGGHHWRAVALPTQNMDENSHPSTVIIDNNTLWQFHLLCQSAREEFG